VKWTKRNPVKSVGGTLVAVALVAISIFWWRALEAEAIASKALHVAQVERDRASTERDRAELAEIEALTERDVAIRESYVNSILAAQLSIDEGAFGEAKQRLEACPKNIRGWEWDHLTLQLSHQSLPISGHSGGIHSLLFHPTSGELISSGSGNSVQTWNPENGELLARNQEFQAPSVAFKVDPNNKLFFMGYVDGVVRVFDMNTNEELHKFQVTERNSREMSELASLEVCSTPESNLLFCGYRNGTTSLYVYERSPNDENKIEFKLSRTASSGIGDSIYSQQGVSGFSLHHSGKYVAITFAHRGSGALMITDPNRGPILQILSPTPMMAVSFSARNPDQLFIGAQPGAIHSLDFSALDKSQFLKESLQEAIENGRIIRVFEGPPQEMPVKFDSQGELFAAGFHNGSVRAWSLQKGYPLILESRQNGNIQSLVLSLDGNYLATGCADSTGRIWDLRAGDLVPSVSLGLISSSAVADIAVHPKGHEIAVLTFDLKIIILDSDSGNLKRCFDGVQYSLNSGLTLSGQDKMTYSPNGQFIGLPLSGTTSIIVDSQTGALQTELQVTRNPKWVEGGTHARSLSWSPDGKQVATGHHDGVLRIWDAMTGQLISESFPKEYRGPIVSVAWSPDGEKVLSGGYGHQAELTAVSSEVLNQLPGESSGPIMKVGWSGNGKYFFIADNSGEIKIRNTENASYLCQLQQPEGGVSDALLSSDGTRLYTTTMQGEVRLWHLQAGVSLCSLKVTGVKATSLAISPDGKRIIVGSAEGTISFLESDSGSLQRLWSASLQSEKVESTIAAIRLSTDSLNSALAMVKTKQDWSNSDREFASLLLHILGVPDAGEKNDTAWDLVNPDRENLDTDVQLALRSIRIVVKEVPDEPLYADTLAWALYANGLFGEAIKASERAIKLAPEGEKTEYQGYLDRLKKMVDEAKE
jgi:WD40 repeat protein